MMTRTKWQLLAISARLVWLPRSCVALTALSHICRRCVAVSCHKLSKGFCRSLLEEPFRQIQCFQVKKESRQSVTYGVQLNLVVPVEQTPILCQCQSVSSPGLLCQFVVFSVSVHGFCCVSFLFCVCQCPLFVESVLCQLSAEKAANQTIVPTERHDRETL